MELSVIVPCFDEEPNIAELANRLERAMGAEEGLHGGEAEILLVDDCSTDGTWAAIQAAEERHPQVRGLRHETNQGIAGGGLL